MSEKLTLFLEDIMRRHRCLPSQMASELGASHATVSRWLSGKDKPSPESCRKLAEYAGLPPERVMSIVGHLPERASPDREADSWPEFREYARRKYPFELDDDLITMIEDLIERRKQRNKPNT